jgi:hypothetical protein
MRLIFISILVLSASITSIARITLEKSNQPVFSEQRGFYTDTFSLKISSDPEGGIIRYTLDGTNPQNSATVIQVQSPARIKIDPESQEGNRAQNPGVVVRACSQNNGYTFSDVETHTFLFVNRVKDLSPDETKPGPNWPEQTRTGQWIDYGMDPDVTSDIRYADLIDDALMDIPTISLVTNLNNLFNPDSGIWVNANMHGPEWERFCSIELLNPDGSEGFQVNAGMRIRGGWSRHPYNPKHAFRLFFREKYGDAKLIYPLFENEGVSEFDKIDLRTSQNYSWSYSGEFEGAYATMTKDVFSRDLQREMGKPYTRSRYYHLYINGVYWGLFQTQERSEARYAQSYFGGDNEDYDVIKPNITSDYQETGIEATDGSLDSWEDVWQDTKTGFGSNSVYFKIQGKNTDGSRNPEYANLVDIENLIDYMFIIFFTGNFDSPTNVWWQNKHPKNFYCIYNRESNEGYKFFIHDAEHTLNTVAGFGPGTVGLYENRVNLGFRTDGYQMTCSQFIKFHPQWLHFRLASNEEFKMLMADRIYELFFNAGLMTPDKTTELFLSRTKEIEMAIIAESARWGDAQHHPARTKDDDWQFAVDDIVDNYFPYRTEIVIDQLKEVGWYPDIDPPVFSSEITEDIQNVTAGFKFKIINPNNDGSIIYTTNGTDPRKIGGNESKTATNGDDEVEITINYSTVVKARIKNGSTWSAIDEVFLVTADDKSNLKVTEIHYHPFDGAGIDNTEYEFLELKNIGNEPINLSGCYFTGNSINYTFPQATLIYPGKFIVIVSNTDQFINRYHFEPSGEYSAQLSNGGETLTLVTPDSVTIFSITYDDNSPWPEEADGLGYSIVPVELNPTGDLNNPSNWRISLHVNGSPGKDDTEESYVKEEPETEFAGYQQMRIYPNPFETTTVIEYSVQNSGHTDLSVYNIMGQKVETLVNTEQPAGNYSIEWNVSEIKTGVYIVVLKVKGKVEYLKIVKN